MSAGAQDSPVAHAADLHDRGTAAAFYEDRFQHGYMETWPPSKLARVGALLRELALPAKGRALDFGCGAGMFTSILRSALPEWEIHGTDISINALETAKRRESSCVYYPLERWREHAGHYDFVFSHHVLEHVPDVQETADMIASLLAPRGTMLHILPCGDAGSFERWICGLRSDGIQEQLEGCFFFEEEGHLRRLTTERLTALWTRSGFRLKQAWYANQLYGALRWMTELEPDFLLQFTASRTARSGAASAELFATRIGLLTLWAARKPQRLVRGKLERRRYGPRDLVLLAAGLPTYPFSRAVDWAVRRLAEREWLRKKSERGGSEMYVLLERS
jgi:SAM-dependent methyltransferase